MRMRRRLFALLGLLLVCAGPVVAQVAPSPSDVQAYEGLHKAAWRGDVASLNAQLKAGADTNARDGHGRTPLHVATFAQHGDVIRALAQAGANLDAMEDDRYDAVTIASVANDPVTLRTLLSLGASARQITSRYDGTALIAASHLGHDEVVRQLVAAGAPLDHVNNLHWTAVIESIVLGDGGPAHQRTLTLLAKAGANLRLTDREGNTPLQLATVRGYTAMVATLKAAGAR